MKLLQFIDPQDGGRVHVGLVEGEEVVDLTQTPAAPHSVYEIYYGQGGDEVGLCEAVRRLRDGVPSVRRLELAELLAARPGA